MKRAEMVLVVLFCVVLCFNSARSSLAATSGSHYPFGGEGVLAGSPPPPGLYYRMYNTWYSPDTLKDDDGDELDVGFDLDIFSSVQRLIHVTEKKLFGADYFYSLIVPLVEKDIAIDALGLSDSQAFSVGDIVIEPFALAWHKPRWDAALALAVIAPTGDYESDEPASIGLGYWSGMLTLGGTYFFDDQRSWSASILTRTLVHTEQEDTDVRPGPEFVVEYGIGKEFTWNEKLLVRPGIAGCAYWQIGDDSDDGPGTFADEHKEAYALGPEINFFLLPYALQANLRALWEFGAKNTSEGPQVILTITKGWNWD